MEKRKIEVLKKIDKYVEEVINNKKISEYIEIDNDSEYKNITIKQLAQLLKIDKYYEEGSINECVKKLLTNVVYEYENLKNEVFNNTEIDEITFEKKCRFDELERILEMYSLLDLDKNIIINIITRWERLTEEEKNNIICNNRISYGDKYKILEAKMAHYGFCILDKKIIDNENLNDIPGIAKWDCNNFENCNQCLENLLVKQESYEIVDDIMIKYLHR